MMTQAATVRRMMKGAAAFGLSIALAWPARRARRGAPSGARPPCFKRISAPFPVRFAHARHAAHPFRYSRARISAPGRNFAAIVVDGNSGQTLYARDEDEPRHPASITKVMTLYLLFEQLERGRLSLDSNCAFPPMPRRKSQPSSACGRAKRSASTMQSRPSSRARPMTWPSPSPRPSAATKSISPNS